MVQCISHNSLDECPCAKQQQSGCPNQCTVYLFQPFGRMIQCISHNSSDKCPCAEQQQSRCPSRCTVYLFQPFGRMSQSQQQFRASITLFYKAISDLDRIHSSLTSTYDIFNHSQLHQFKNLLDKCANEAAVN